MWSDNICFNLCYVLKFTNAFSLNFERNSVNFWNINLLIFSSIFLLHFPLHARENDSKSNEIEIHYESLIGCPVGSAKLWENCRASEYEIKTCDMALSKRLRKREMVHNSRIDLSIGLIHYGDYIANEWFYLPHMGRTPVCMSKLIEPGAKEAA